MGTIQCKQPNLGDPVFQENSVPGTAWLRLQLASDRLTVSRGCRCV